VFSQIYCRGELSEEEKGAYKWWLFDVSECSDDTTDAERSVIDRQFDHFQAYWYVGLLFV